MPLTGYPDRKDVPQRHTDKAPTLSRISRRRGEQNGGDDGRSPMIQKHPPGEGPGRHGAPSGGNLPGHRPGSGRTLFGGLCQAGPYARSFLERKFQGPSPPCQRDACSGNRRRTRRRKEPHTLLRQVASGASSETSMTHPEGGDPDRRRSLGFLTVQFLEGGERAASAEPLSPLVGEKAISMN